MSPEHRASFGVMCSFALAAAVLAGAQAASAQSVTIGIPASKTFVVQNVNTATGGLQTIITWSNPTGFGSKHLRISVRADTANFTAPSPGRSKIAANKISWTIGAATNGTGIAGTLGTSYVILYNATAGKTSGSVTLNWNLSAIGSNVRSGNHQNQLQWRLQAVN